MKQNQEIKEILDTLPLLNDRETREMLYYLMGRLSVVAKKESAVIADSIRKSAAYAMRDR